MINGYRHRLPTLLDAKINFGLLVLKRAVDKQVGNVTGEGTELTPAKAFCKQTSLYTRYALQDVSRNKCNFCLAFCSVFMVVFSILVVKTVVSVGPLVFLA